MIAAWSIASPDMRMFSAIRRLRNRYASLRRTASRDAGSLVPKYANPARGRFATSASASAAPASKAAMHDAANSGEKPADNCTPADVVAARRAMLGLRTVT
jgi:hypothetical protein